MNGVFLRRNAISLPWEDTMRRQSSISWGEGYHQEPDHADTLITDFQPPGPWENHPIHVICYCSPNRLRCHPTEHFLCKTHCSLLVFLRLILRKVQGGGSCFHFHFSSEEVQSAHAKPTFAPKPGKTKTWRCSSRPDSKALVSLTSILLLKLSDHSGCSCCEHRRNAGSMVKFSLFR